MYVRASVSVQHRWCFHELLAILASLTLERLVRLAKCVLPKLEQFAQLVAGKVSFGIFLFVDDTRGQSLF